jgi:response regulator RpfG family c-di-GMP phosphodiesterase
VRSAAERWDGAGYPDGLAGNEIPLPSRIIFACDAYEAMTSERPYRPALSRRQALSELRQNAGTQFDPQAVAALCAVVEDDIGRYSPAPAPQSPAGPGRTRRGSVPPPSATARR